MKSLMYLICFGMVSNSFVCAAENNNKSFDINSIGVVRKLEVCCIPDIITTITAVTPERFDRAP
jgi:hypothetical protein